MASLGRADVVAAIVNDRADGSGVVVVVTVGRPVVVMVVVVAAVVMAGVVGVGAAAAVGIAGLLPLAVLLVLHPPILEPDLDLTFRQVEIARQFPALLLRHVSVEQKLFFQLQRLELGVGFPLLANSHLSRPFQRIRSQWTYSRKRKKKQIWHLLRYTLRRWSRHREKKPKWDLNSWRRVAAATEFVTTRGTVTWKTMDGNGSRCLVGANGLSPSRPFRLFLSPSAPVKSHLAAFGPWRTFSPPLF